MSRRGSLDRNEPLWRSASVDAAHTRDDFESDADPRLRIAMQRRWKERGGDRSSQQGSAADAGTTLDSEVARKVEASTQADLSRVRVHSGAASAEAARSLKARAFTVGQDIHFGAGQYQPGTPEGEHLLTHELVHTIQQRGAPSAPQTKLEVSEPGDASEREADAAAASIVAGDRAHVHERAPARVARAVDADGWNEAYGDKKVGNQDFGTFEDTIGEPGGGRELQNASDSPDEMGHKGTKAAPFDLTAAELVKLSGYKVQQLVDKNPEAIEMLDQAIFQMKEAFDVMKIDTVESQAQFIAHAAWESVFSRLTEGQKQDFDQNPTNQTMDMKDPNGPMAYAGDPRIDPLHELGGGGKPTPTAATEGNSFENTFIGRGPLQVTQRQSYLKVLAYMEHRLEQGDLDDKEKDTLERAVTEIKADPSAAGKAEYAYLFSAAAMQETGLVTQRKFSTMGMSGGHGTDEQNQKLEKETTFAAVKERLLQKAKAWQEEQEQNQRAADPKCNQY